MLYAPSGMRDVHYFDRFWRLPNNYRQLGALPPAPHMSAFGSKADMTRGQMSAFAVAIGVKRTWVGALHMSASDPKRTFDVA